MTSPYLTPKEVASYYKVSMATVQSWRDKGVGPGWVKVEGGIRYPISEIERYDNERAEQAQQRTRSS